MNCQDVKGLLHPYSDGELDLVRQIEMGEHFSGCPTCDEQQKNLRSLRDAISSPSLAYRASDSLRSRVRGISPAAIRTPQRFSRKLSAAIAAGVLLLIGIATTVGIVAAQNKSSKEGELAERVVAGHIRSLQAEHLVDVASSDRHTVKPWFHGKLDFSISAPDLTEQGFTLTGGRLDYLADRPVAAIIYNARKHAINLFIWPAANNDEEAVRSLSRQGFNLRSWKQAGMTFWAISDLNGADLDEFVRAYRQRSSE